MGDKQTSRTRTHMVATSDAEARVSAHTINNHRVLVFFFFLYEVERIQGQVNENVSKVGSEW